MYNDTNVKFRRTHTMNGILNLKKPKGITSHDCVSKCRKIFGTKRVGHAGTLDPMATGVLPVLIGNACSAQEELMNHDKTYVAGIRLGMTTDTGDVTGEVLSECKDIPEATQVELAVKSFVGEYDQIPPMYSALKVDGKKLYELAREGVTVERKARRITVYSAKILDNPEKTDYIVEFSVSKGTYIRTLAEDIGSKLGCGACLYSLERTVCGGFDEKASVTIEELDSMKQAENGDELLEKSLISCEKAFEHLPCVKLSQFYSGLCKNGQEIYLSRAKIDERLFAVQQRCRIYDSDGTFFAIGERRDYPAGHAVKAVMRFDTK